MKKNPVTGFLILLLFYPLAAVEISLGGTVKTSDGKGIPDAEILLKNQSMLKATTNSQGEFSLVSTGILQQSKTTPGLRLIVSKKYLAITSANEFSSGIVDFFSIDGSRISTLPLKKGEPLLPLPQGLSGFVIIRVTTGHETVSRGFIFAHSEPLCFNNNRRLYAVNTQAEKRSQASSVPVDTLIVTKKGFLDKKVPVETYRNENIEIILWEESGELPLVYDKENTGEGCKKPPLLAFSELPSIDYLPDPFLKADGTRITTREEWRCRRAEIKAILEHYDVGEKPGKPGIFEASLSGNKINIKVGEGSNTFTITATISKPAGAANVPLPAIIGINTPTGSLPADLFSKRGIATITYSSSQLVSMTGARGDGNFMKLYPKSTAGYMIRWAWGVSRIIDALEMLPEAGIDVKRLAVSGCSYQGKIALYAGAFDERIALTIPHESGGGGTISWRYSDMLEDRDKTEVENLHHAQGAPWYAASLTQFNNAPDKLPFDHHELIGMIAPRAVLCIESSAIARMGAEAARVDALAAHKIWEALGVADRMGATEQNVNHCQWHNGFTADLEAFIDKFLLGKENVNTDILRSKFTKIDEKKWIPWDAPELK